MSAAARAVAPAEAPGILTARTLADGHPGLLALLRPGMSVLDVGCGPGALTAEMARRAAPGHVVGVDANPEMILAAEAANPPDRLPNLVFYAGDIRQSRWEGEFDLVNAARTLQWIRDPALAVRRMAAAVAPGGRIVLLDVDHTRAEWGAAPTAWTRFYRAFLDWRAAAGLDNAIARRLDTLCAAAGLVGARVSRRAERVSAGDPQFFRAAGRWRMIIESRGRHMVAAGVLAESERREALEAFTEWMRRPDAAQTLHEACAVARRARP